MFHANRFVYFEGKDGISNFNDWIMNNGRKEKDKVAIEVIPFSQKSRPSIKMK